MQRVEYICFRCVVLCVQGGKEELQKQACIKKNKIESKKYFSKWVLLFQIQRFYFLAESFNKILDPG